jgi:hypothetical protein
MPRYCAWRLRLSTADLANPECFFAWTILLKRRGREGHRREAQSNYSADLCEDLCDLWVNDVLPRFGRNTPRFE